MTGQFGPIRANPSLFAPIGADGSQFPERGFRRNPLIWVKIPRFCLRLSNSTRRTAAMKDRADTRMCCVVGKLSRRRGAASGLSPLHFHAQAETQGPMPERFPLARTSGVSGKSVARREVVGG